MAEVTKRLPYGFTDARAPGVQAPCQRQDKSVNTRVWGLGVNDGNNSQYLTVRGLTVLGSAVELQANFVITRVWEERRVPQTNRQNISPSSMFGDGGGSGGGDKGNTGKRGQGRAGQEGGLFSGGFASSKNKPAASGNRECHRMFISRSNIMLRLLRPSLACK